MTEHVPASNRGGRPTRLTPETKDQLLKLVRLGAPVELCAQGAGISDSAFYNWMGEGRREMERIERGEEPDPDKAHFLDLYNDVTAARLDAATRNVGAIQKAVQGGAITEETTRTFRDHEGQIVTEKTIKRQAPDWRAGAWFLERQFARYYGKAAETIQITGAEGGPIQVQADATDLAKRLAEHLASGAIPAAAAATRELTAADRATDPSTDPADEAAPDEVLDAELVD